MDAIENTVVRDLCTAVEVNDVKKIEEEMTKRLEFFWPHVAKYCDQ